jgi:hypothetical protein
MITRRGHIALDVKREREREEAGNMIIVYQNGQGVLFLRKTIRLNMYSP